MKNADSWKSGASGRSEEKGSEMKSMSGSFGSQSSTATTERDFDTLRRDFLRLRDTVSDLAQKQALTAKDQLAGTVEAVGQRVGTTAAATQDSLLSFEADLEERVRRQPLGAIILSLLVGVAIGKML
jgi:hypothetical protein